jgi:hypothetical protein
VDANQKMIFISFIRVYLWLKGVNRYSRYLLIFENRKSQSVT